MSFCPPSSLLSSEVLLAKRPPKPATGKPATFFQPVLGTVFPRELSPWEFDINGTQDILSCTLEDNNDSSNTYKIFDPNEWKNELLIMGLMKIAKKNAKIKNNSSGICKSINDEAILREFNKLLKTAKGVMGLYDYFTDYYQDDVNEPYDLLRVFIGQDNTGSIFDLGGFAKCETNLPDVVDDTFMANFCKKASEENTTLSPMVTWDSFSVDAEGLPSFKGVEKGEGNKAMTIKQVKDRNYSSGKDGKYIYTDTGSSTNGDPDGGVILADAKNDPYGSTAVALNSFDKSTIFLKTLAATTLEDNKTHKPSLDAGAIRLPDTHGDSIDKVDEVVNLQVRMTADLNQFADTLTRALQKEFSEIDLQPKKKDGTPDTTDGKPHLMSFARYQYEEKKAARKYFKSKKSGLAKIYEGIENEVKAKLASQMVLMSTDPNYIADPSEARAALIKPAQRNKFRYAALIQQEKNKQLKLKYALEIKRKQQMIDIIKQQALIRASLFRYETVRHELAHILSKVDESVSL